MDNIQEVLKKYFMSWNEGFRTKDEAGIKSYMSKDFVGYWSHSGIQEPDPYYYDYDLNSVLKQMDNAEKSFDVATISKRNNGKEALVLGRETNVINRKAYTAQSMLVWRNEEGGWKLLREYIELEK